MFKHLFLYYYLLFVIWQLIRAGIWYCGFTASDNQSLSIKTVYLSWPGSIHVSNISAFQQHSWHNFILLGMIILLKWVLVSRLGLEHPLGAARFPVQSGKIGKTIVQTWTGILRVSYTCLNLLRNTGVGDSFHFRTFCKISDHNALIGVKCVSNADTDLGCVLRMTAPHLCLVDRFGEVGSLRCCFPNWIRAWLVIMG